MSLVGTRPPTVDEWEQYELHHRSRMSTKPGITGMIDARVQQNMTQKDLSAKTGITQADISRIENGTRNRKFFIPSKI